MFLVDVHQYLQRDAQQNIHDKKQCNTEDIEEVEHAMALHQERTEEETRQRGTVCTSWAPRLTDEQIQDLNNVYTGTSVTKASVDRGRREAETPLRSLDALSAYDMDAAFDENFFPKMHVCTPFGKWVAAYRTHFHNCVIEFLEPTGFGFSYFAFTFGFQQPLLAAFVPLQRIIPRIADRMFLDTRVSDGFHRNFHVFDWAISPLAYSHSTMEMGNPNLDSLNVT